MGKVINLEKRREEKEAGWELVDLLDNVLDDLLLEGDDPPETDEAYRQACEANIKAMRRSLDKYQRAHKARTDAEEGEHPF